jgi:AcrR family transcriptional regulator
MVVFMSSQEVARVRILTALPGERLDDGLVVPTQRGRMLDAITAAVAEKGYGATTVADVISIAGVSRKTFYEHFEDKEDCYLAAYQLGTNYIIARLQRGEGQANEALADRTARVLRGYLHSLALSPLAARAFLVEVCAAGTAAQERRRNILDQFADVLWPTDDTRTDTALTATLRTGLVAAIDEVAARQVVAGHTADLPALEAPLTELAMRILSPGTSPSPGQPSDATTA